MPSNYDELCTVHILDLDSGQGGVLRETRPTDDYHTLKPDLQRQRNVGEADKPRSRAIFSNLHVILSKKLEPDNEMLGMIPTESLSTTDDTIGVRKSDQDDDMSSILVSPTSEASSRLVVEIPESTLVTPRSCHEPFDIGVPVMSEAQALANLASAWRRLRIPTFSDDSIEYRLDEFAVYLDTFLYSNEMRPLTHLDTKLGHSGLLFSGILSIDGENKVFVKDVSIAAMPIDNYGDLSKHTVRGDIWLLSEYNVDRNNYYRLQNPAREYVRFFEPSLWVADLAKHFVDFLKTMGEAKRRISIHHFRTDFGTWLGRTHKKAPAFLKWLKQHPSQDFRTSVVANIAFLHKESIGVLNAKKTYTHLIWSEIWNFSCYTPRARAPDTQTVVTQYIHDCFEHMIFGNLLEVVPMSEGNKKLRSRLIRKRHLELQSSLHDGAKTMSTAAEERIRNVKAGDTISTHRDDALGGSKWKREISKGFDDVDRWFALVLRVHMLKSGRRVFDVIWYYRPVDTLCGLMKYPWNNELFLSDHCSCAEKQKIRDDEVLGVHDVDFGGTSTTSAEFFCRQTYIHEERKWITLTAQHLQCDHAEEKDSTPLFQIGDTLLVHIDKSGDVSEPCELVSNEDNGETIHRLRRLPRRRDVDPAAGSSRPNELVYSDIFIECEADRVIGRCDVRVYSHEADIPSPYNRDGVAGFFYLTHRNHEQQRDPDIRASGEASNNNAAGLRPVSSHSPASWSRPLLRRRQPWQRTRRRWRYPDELGQRLRQQSYAYVHGQRPGPGEGQRVPRLHRRPAAACNPRRIFQIRAAHRRGRFHLGRQPLPRLFKTDQR